MGGDRAAGPVRRLLLPQHLRDSFSCPDGLAGSLQGPPEPRRAFEEPGDGSGPRAGARRGWGRFREGAARGEGYKPDPGSLPRPRAAPGSGRRRPRAHAPHKARVPTRRPAARPRPLGRHAQAPPALSALGAPEGRPARPHSLPPPPESPSRQLGAERVGARRSIPGGAHAGKGGGAPPSGRPCRPARSPSALPAAPLRPALTVGPAAPEAATPQRQRQRRSGRPPGLGPPSRRLKPPSYRV